MQKLALMMQKTTLIAAALILATALPLIAADAPPPPGNVWQTADGETYFTCPVMKGEMRLDQAESYSDVDGLRYYHCCPPCQGPFRANPGKWLSEHALPANITEVDSHGHKLFRDPVSGEMGIVEEGTPQVDHQGRRFYFTSAGSAQSFRANPAEHTAELAPAPWMSGGSNAEDMRGK